MKFARKLIAVLLSVVMMASMMMATSVFAAEDTAAKLTGDVDGDGKVAMGDVVNTQKNIAKLMEFDEATMKLADVDAPYGEITMTDVTSMQKYIAKLFDKFPVEEQTTDSDTEADTTSDTTDVSSDSEVDTSSEATSDTEDDGVLSLSEARAAGEGATVKLRGQVTYIYGSNTIILEEVEDGKVVSFQLYDKAGVEAGNYPMNAIVEVTGKISTYNTVLQISGPTEVKLVSEDNAPIAPVESTVEDLGDYLATCVVIKDVTFTSVDDSNATITDATGSVNLYKPAALPEGYVAGMTFDLVCCPYFYNGNVQIRVSSTDDYKLEGLDDTTDEDFDLTEVLAELQTLVDGIIECGDSTNDEGMYTADSYATFKLLYDEALAALERNGENYTERELKDLYEDLTDKWLNLAFVPSYLLNDLVEAIKSWRDDTNDLGFYTAESYADFAVLYEMAVEYLADNSTLSDEDALALNDELLNMWNNGLEYVNDLAYYVSTAIGEGADTNANGWYKEGEEYDAFLEMFNQALAHLADPDNSVLSDTQVAQLTSDFHTAFMELPLAKAGLIEFYVQYYVDELAPYYDIFAAEDSLAGVLAAYDVLVDIVENPDNYTEEEVNDAIITFEEEGEKAGIFEE